jgi:hypothetical protein
MASGIIDASTLYELIHLFREQKPEAASAWTWRCSTEVTCALIHGRHLGIAHTPALGLYADPWGDLQRRLSDQVRLITPPARVQGEARRVADSWALSDKGVRLLGKMTGSSFYDTRGGVSQRSFPRYMENMVVHTWPYLAGPHDIFEKRNIRAISRATGFSQAELRRAHEASKDRRVLDRFASNPSLEDELLAIIWGAYLVDLLIRGRYHDEVARMQDGQVLHHPARSPALKQLAASRTRYGVTNTDRAFSNIILAGALAERSQKKRIDLWLHNVLTARRAAQSGHLTLAAQEGDGDAERAAARQALELGLRTHPRSFDHVADALITAGTGLLTTFVLSGWTDLAIDVVTYAATRPAELGTRTGRLAFERQKRLEGLASSTGGRVDREWS